MKKRPTTTITIPIERAIQLREIAKARGLTVSDLIARFIEGEIRKGTIPDAIPGLNVVKAGRTVLLELDDVKLELDLRSAEEIADGIEQVVSEPYFEGEIRGKVVKAYGEFHLDPMGRGYHFSAHRRGRGIILRLKRGRQQAEKSLNLYLARDLAKLIRRASKPAQSG